MRFTFSVAHGLCLFAGAMLLTGCGGSVLLEDGAKYTIGMSQCNLGEPWRVQMNADIKAAADKHAELAVVFKNAGNDSSRQKAHVRELIERGVDLIIISPKETDALTEAIDEAMARDIPVIVVDRALGGDNYTCFIGADNVKIGRAAGKWLVQTLKKKAVEKPRVVELKGLMTSQPGQDRNRGFREAIEGSDLEVIAEPDMQWLQERAQAEMRSALDVHDRIDAVYAHNDPGARGAYLAAEDAGREKEMIFIGIDALPDEGLAYVKSDILDATFLNPTGGAEAIDTALKILAGKQVPKKITLQSRLFTKENVQQGGELLESDQALPERL